MKMELFLLSTELRFKDLFRFYLCNAWKTTFSKWVITHCPPNPLPTCKESVACITDEPASDQRPWLTPTPPSRSQLQLAKSCEQGHQLLCHKGKSQRNAMLFFPLVELYTLWLQYHTFSENCFHDFFKLIFWPACHTVWRVVLVPWPGVKTCAPSIGRWS